MYCVETPIPILKLGQALLVPIYADLSDEAALALQERLLYRLQETGARGVVIDITVLDVVDSFLGQVFSDLSRMVSLMDGVTVLVGMRPQVAMTLVEMGLELRGLLSALDLEQGLDLVARKLAERDALLPSSNHATENRPTEKISVTPAGNRSAGSNHGHGS